MNIDKNLTDDETLEVDIETLTRDQLCCLWVECFIRRFSYWFSSATYRKFGEKMNAITAKENLLVSDLPTGVRSIVGQGIYIAGTNEHGHKSIAIVPQKAS